MAASYDVAIIGAGVTGTALLHVLTRYTDVGSVAVLERYREVAQVNSKSTANSQTLHLGDIETNYSPQKALKVSTAARRVARYLERAGRDGIAQTHSKMVLGVGQAEVELLRKRYLDLKPIFPGLEVLDRDALAKAEPAVVAGRPESEAVAALRAGEGLTVDFGRLSTSFVMDARASGKKLDEYFGVQVAGIARRRERFRVDAGSVKIDARAVVCAAGATSLLFAHELGVGLEYAILPVAGDFFSAPRVLNGKVYTVQDERLPFAAVHGDPDSNDPHITRFGPTARVLPLLERGDLLSFFGFLRSTRLDPRLALRLCGLLADDAIRGFAWKNALYTLPWLGRARFAEEARKIVPGLRASDLRPADRPGGIRPQLVDRRSGRLHMGEAKLVGEGILFDVTPSPGASVCLKNAEEDARLLSSWLGLRFDEVSFSRDFEAT
ncbi:MAG: FAD-dependent oxidoreductase [Elusimicrobia bacterium]|nr:FAD-dependent oxidoreductase [Elusimicrobiota bacterium]